MNPFQLFSTFIVLAAIIYLVYKVLTRNQNKVCNICRQKNMKDVVWDNDLSQSVEVDSDEESSLSDDSEVDDAAKDE